MCNINIQSKPTVVLLVDKPEFLGGIEGGWYIEYSDKKESHVFSTPLV